MALRWLLHSACDVIGYPSNDVQIKGSVNLKRSENVEMKKEMCPPGFQMPLHYPRYSKSDYEKMEEWKIDVLLRQYGLSFEGALEEKREYAMGAFLWPDQY